MNFQVTVLKILVSYSDGFALMEDLKRDMAILATSGREWADRTKRPGSGSRHLFTRACRTHQRRMADHGQWEGSARVHGGSPRCARTDSRAFRRGGYGSDSHSKPASSPASAY
ncbi:bll8036 [Bradyrhizobium diazoefficiens USDA 110]|uniref:Bll8036 protein n=1 Tax=Bradyrhizobium diazoefficiens (strain JCM 10833 / BCRC 13528 / IAM 13628 / NBRC 14792 / USDA 110) TaxID=224911 RepID=Q89BW2_BRADU|nr:hypothetical protein Bdiaspc4_42510 [Bradyrhizobium diazoefficiens]BAC53301.1 bll8036 [Bradyrhizobium diazoefficiens USDA 110]